MNTEVKLENINKRLLLTHSRQIRLLLAGEVGNSQGTTAEAMATVWPEMRKMGMDSALVPVYWDLCEPVEGNRDWTLVKTIIDDARRHNMKLVLLWFGTYKNMMSCYAPGWVKRDTKRFVRVKDAAGQEMEIISPLCTEAMNADAAAWADFMRFLRNYDSTHQTVLMVQVENETGLIPGGREYSHLAQAAWQQPVPAEVLTLIKSGRAGTKAHHAWEQGGRKDTGSWADVFDSAGDERVWGEEIFTAWNIARFVQTVAAAGKKEYPLPVFVNAALVRPNYTPGKYAAGGPLPHLAAVWHLAAPALDLLCPDIYFPCFDEWAAKYAAVEPGLLIPEAALNVRTGANAVVSMLGMGAMGFAPFSAENAGDEVKREIAAGYEVVRAFWPVVEQVRQRGGQVAGVAPHITFDWKAECIRHCQFKIGPYDIRVKLTFDRPAGTTDVSETELPTLGMGRWEAPENTPRGSAVIAVTGDEELLIIGRSMTVEFEPVDAPQGTKIGIDSCREIELVGGIAREGRWLGGDQTHQGRHVRFLGDAWGTQRVKVYQYGG
jgi:hypothetical protein